MFGDEQNYFCFFNVVCSFEKTRKQKPVSPLSASRYWSKTELVQLRDAVDGEAKVRRAAELGLVEDTVFDCFASVANPIAIGVDCEVGGNRCAANGELRGVKDVQSAIFDRGFGSGNRFSGSARSFRPALRIMFAPVAIPSDQSVMMSSPAIAALKA